MISDEFCQITGKYNRNAFFDQKKPIEDIPEKSNRVMKQKNARCFTEAGKKQRGIPDTLNIAPEVTARVRFPAAKINGYV